ncbi:MAG: hypothetical protein K8F24_07945, partial [Bacteroidales bacterium]|nr:hypothetical protein [Bacteroidales bacterium]
DCTTSTHPRWDGNSTHFGLDLVGFSALPGGYHFYDVYNRIGKSGYYWSSTTDGYSHAWGFSVHFTLGFIATSSDFRTDGSSVRCIKNN